MRRWAGICLLFLLIGCGRHGGDDGIAITVSAAASLTEPLERIGAGFERRHPGIAIRFNFGGSGALRQQIEQGAPVDVFVSASVEHMQALTAQGLIDEDMLRNVAANRLALVVPRGEAVPETLDELASDEYAIVAIGIPDSVPAGLYAKQALFALGLWDELASKTVQAKDVRRVLQYVETGNADAGFVYASDAASTDRVETAAIVDGSLHDPILYPAGVASASRHQREAEQFFAYLLSDEAVRILTEYGFTAID